MLRLQNGVIQFGIEPRCGGTLAELIVNGRNLINNADCTGRQVQTALYDGDDSYDSCGGCQGVWGWDPVQGGDVYGFGSPLSAQSAGPDFIYTATQALEWFPDDKGGGPGRPVVSDVSIEQTAAFVPGHPEAVRLHYRITHLGGDSHTLGIQELPAVYANLGFDHFVTYTGTAPWTGGSVTWDALGQPGSPVPQHYVPEHWAALVDDQGAGLTVYVPQQYPYVAGVHLPGTSGEYGSGANYFRPHVPFAFGPQAVLDADVYVIAGDYRTARHTIEALHAAGPAPDILPPYGWLETPSAGQAVSGTKSVSGWVFDDLHVSRVEVLLDGIVAGTAAYGLNRPDIQAAFPNASPSAGFSYGLDSTRYANGAHQFSAKAIDDAGNAAVLGSWAIVISNAGDTTPPSVSITSVQSTKKTVSVMVKATDSVGVSRVDLFVDGQFVGSDSTGPYAFALPYSSFSRGSHTFIATARDAAGNAGTSAPVTWTRK
ncbi:MAG TPA: Ig-like domain-containing protein, partial [Vicinamibacterales bacterium]|nr:Ig-like domain-containing protein [Vicinamibacterales bacterium]